MAVSTVVINRAYNIIWTFLLTEIFEQCNKAHKYDIIIRASHWILIY